MNEQDPGLGPDIVKRKLALRAFDKWAEKAWHMMLYVVFFIFGCYTTMWWVARTQESVEPCKIVNVCTIRDVATSGCMRYQDVTNPAWTDWKLNHAASGAPERLR